VLGQGARAHAIQGPKHGLDGAQVLLGNHHLEEFGVLFCEFWIESGEFGGGGATGHEGRNGAQHGAQKGRSFLGVKGEGLGFGFRRRLVDALLVNAGHVHSDRLPDFFL